MRTGRSAAREAVRTDWAGSAAATSSQKWKADAAGRPIRKAQRTSQSSRKCTCYPIEPYPSRRSTETLEAPTKQGVIRCCCFPLLFGSTQAVAANSLISFRGSYPSLKPAQRLLHSNVAWRLFSTRSSTWSPRDCSDQPAGSRRSAQSHTSLKFRE